MPPFCRALIRPDRIHAFTLLEMLSVIAVIAIVASLILPALGRVKDRAGGITCLNNLKQWGVATHLYAADNDDLLPPDGAPNGTSTRQGWYVDLPSAIGIPPYHTMPWRTNAAADLGITIWICPANQRRSNGRNLFHYCLNQHVNRTGVGNQVKLAAVPGPARVVWLFDNGKLAAVAQQNNVHPDLHDHGAQFVFLDGHATRFPSEAYWDFTANRGRTNHPELVWVPTEPAAL